MNRREKKALKIATRNAYKEVIKDLPRNDNGYGEPQGYISAYNGRNIEVTLECGGLPKNEWYYLVRLNCSEEEFDNDVFHGSCGVISETVTEGLRPKELKESIYVELRNSMKQW